MSCSAAGCLLAGLAASTALLAKAAPADERESSTYVAIARVLPDSTAANGVTGVVQSAQPLQASAATGGRLVFLQGQIGDTVVAGQVLARIDSQASGLRVDQADAEVQQAAAAASERSSAAKRAATLVGIGAMSDAERQAAHAEAQAGQSKLRAARDAAALARTEAQFNVVRAPADGIVAARNVELGSVVSPGQVLFAIEGAVGSVILAAVPQTLVARIQPGQVVRYDADGIQGVARIASVSPRVEDGGVVPVRLTVDGGRPAAGAIVRVHLAAGSSEDGAVRVPLSALQTESGGRHYVYRLDEHNRAVQIPVTVLSLSGADARISASVPVGAIIVAAGGAFLQPGQAVRIATPGA